MSPGPARRRRASPSASATVAAVEAVDLAIEQQEFFALLGPSGSGKTTMLRIVAGLETPDRGPRR